MNHYGGRLAEKYAQECEDRGPGVTYPIGCIYGDHADDSMYDKITFAVAENRIEGHSNRGSSWACRDTGYGDSIGLEKCGGSTLWMSKSCGNLNPRTPHFKRMLSFLRSQQIDITVWDGEKPISIATFYKLHRQGKLPWNEIQ
jgi:hypothetical protein